MQQKDIQDMLLDEYKAIQKKLVNENVLGEHKAKFGGREAWNDVSYYIRCPSDITHLV